MAGGEVDHNVKTLEARRIVCQCGWNLKSVDTDLRGAAVTDHLLDAYNSHLEAARVKAEMKA